MFDMHKNHRNLVNTAIFVFLTLSTLIAIIPAYQMQSVKPLPTMKDMTKEERHGLGTYVSEGCVACHTQQVRNIEMDNVWGNRPSIPADYYYSKRRLDGWRQSPSLLGSERTGPDLTSIGQRNPSDTWHLMHLFNPRIVVPESIMPGYPWLFETKQHADPDEQVLNVPPSLKPPGQVVVPTQEANDLVAYLLSLKQVELPDIEKKFIPSRKRNDASQTSRGATEESAIPDGQALYQSNCAACHQPGGEGLPGAFPALNNSKVV